MRYRMVIIQDIISHASVRKLEWIMTGLMIHLGWIFIQPGDLFDGRPAFSVLAQYATANSWGLLFLTFGIIRLIVLIMNGTHIKQSSEIRMFLSAISFIILCMWIWGIDSSDATVTGGATYKWLALGELANVWQSSADRLKRKALRNAGVDSKHT